MSAAAASVCTRTASWQACQRTAATVKSTGSWLSISAAVARACAVTKTAIARMRPKHRAATGPTTAPTSATTLEIARTADTAERDIPVC